MSSESEYEKPSVDDVKRPLYSLLSKSSDFPRSILLQGEWGVGKTCLWHDVVQETAPDSRPIYASLFGMSTLSSVKFGIVTRDLEFIDDSDSGKSSGSKGFLKSVYQFLSKSDRLSELAESTASNLGVSVSATLLSDLAYQSIKGKVLCFDDVERRSLSLDLAELLGMIENLQTEKDCKVLCIVNPSGLEEADRNTLDSYKERVFEQIVTLDPPADYSKQFVRSVSIADENMDAIILDHLRGLNLGNVRVVNKAIRLFDQFRETFPDCKRRIEKQVLHSLILICAAEHIGPPNFPSVDFLRSFNVYADTEEDKIKTTWQKKLRDYNWWAPDKIDNELFYYVRNGVIRSGRLREAIRSVDQEIGAHETEEVLRKAWKRFHDSFDDDGDEVVSAIFDATKAHIGGLSANTLDATLRLLKEIGRDADASDLIASYIAHSSGNRERLDLDYSMFGNDVSDPSLRKSLAEALAEPEEQVTIRFVIEKSLERGSIDSRDLPKLASLSQEDWSDLILSIDGKNVQSLLTMIGSIQMRDQDENAKSVYELTCSAVEELAAGSPIRQMRLARWGLSFLIDKH